MVVEGGQGNDEMEFDLDSIVSLIWNLVVPLNNKRKRERPSSLFPSADDEWFFSFSLSVFVSVCLT